MPKLIPSILALLACSAPAQAQLLVDFNSTTQGGGPTLEQGYQPYDAGHEVAADFVPVTYATPLRFGDFNVTVTPAWPNTTDNRVMQMIDRSGGNDANWVGDNIDLITDWIGCDSRTANGGNGDWYRTSGTPTYFTLTLSGLPACEYDWVSLHHDTENIWSDFQVEVSVDGGATFSAAADMEMTSSSPGGNPPDPFKETGSSDPDPHNLTSTYRTTFMADGTSDVVLRFAPFADGVDGVGVHKQFFGMNAFELFDATGEPYCEGAANSVGPGAELVASGTTSIAANDLALHSLGVPNEPGVFVYGTTQIQSPFGQGYLCVTGVLQTLYPPVFATGNRADRAIDFGALSGSGQITAGSTWNFQHLYRDKAAGAPAFNTSSALELTFVP